MSSVDEIALQENYIEIKGFTAEKRPIVRVYPERRNWSRNNYELDLRYIETVLWAACAAMPEHVQKMVIECDCSSLSVFHNYSPRLYNRLLKTLRQKFKERVYEIRLLRPSVSANILYWWYKNEFPYSFSSKLKFVN